MRWDTSYAVAFSLLDYIISPIRYSGNIGREVEIDP